METKPAANIRPSFTSEQALAISRAVGAAIGLARGVGANTEFTLQDVATLRNARLTLAGAMAVAMDEERKANEEATRASDV